jgi:signal transduction histidine kinase/ActR/RegA family two-component response regulator
MGDTGNAGGAAGRPGTDTRPGGRPAAPTLRSRLFLLVAAVAVPLLLLGAAVIYDSYLGERARAEERLRAQALALASVLDREVGQVRAVLSTLAASSALAAGDLVAFDHEMRAASVSLRGAGIALIDRDNRQVLATVWPLGERRTGKQGPEQLREVFQTGRPALTDLFRGRNSGRLTIAVGVPVFAPVSPGPAASVAYVLAAGVPASLLSALLEEQHLQPGWVGGVLDRTLHVIARTAEPERFIGTEAIPAQRAAMQAALSGVVHTPRADGVPASIVFQHAPESGFTVALAVPEDVFEAPLRSELWHTLLLGAVVSGAGLGLALAMARRLAAAIDSLADGCGEGAAPRLREVERAAGRLARTAAERDAAAAALRALAERLEQDVAERTEALAQSEARLRAIFDAQFQYITLLTPEGRRLEMNRGALDFAAAEWPAPAGQLVWDAPWWRGDPAVAAALRHAVARAAAGEASRFELPANTSAGRNAILDVSIRPVREGGDGVVRLLIIEGHDITDLRALEARVAQTSRLEALGQLAGGIAHDFNNVLQSIAGGVSLIARRSDDPAAVRRLTDVVMEAIGRGASVTRRLLGFARQDVLTAAPVDVADLLGNLREVLHHTLGVAIRVSVDLPPDLPPLLADRAQLETVLVNLATNSRDAMARGGTLRLTAAAEVLTSTSAGTGLAPGRYIRLSAADSGGGMDAATLARAMEPFFTTKPTGKGTGLGLSMARGFALQSGGALTIESQPGLGTTVTLWLPQAPSPLATVAPSSQAGDMPSARYRLLLVDDNAVVRELMAAALEAAGHMVVQAADGTAAVAILEAAADQPADLIVTDLTMPGMDGLDVIRTSHRRWPTLPVVLLTGYAGEAIEAATHAALEQSNVSLLRKPVTEAQLIARVAALLSPELAAG